LNWPDAHKHTFPVAKLELYLNPGLVSLGDELGNEVFIESLNRVIALISSILCTTVLK